MVLHVYTATAPLVTSDRPVLLKGPSTINRWLVDACRHINVVITTVAERAAFALPAAARIEIAKVLDDVVFDEWVARPAVDGQISVALRVKGAAIVYGAAAKS